uniref:Uncharacterized protein n=1 Tax=Arundo donax TaxID=35708 RepID=A0A0A9GX90_ARUDO
MFGCSSCQLSPHVSVMALSYCDFHPNNCIA